MLLDTQATSSLDFSVLTNALSSAITPEGILTCMAAVVTGTATIFLVKWAGNLLVRGVTRVTRGGNIRV